MSMVGPPGTWKSQINYNRLKNGTFQTKQQIFFEQIDSSLKNNSTKYLLIIVDSSEKTWKSKVFVDIATAGRHRGLRTIHVEQILIYRSKLQQDVELQITHFVLSISQRDVMQVSTLNAQFGLGLELVEMQHRLPAVTFWLIFCRAQTVDFAIVQTMDPSHQIFIPRTSWNF